MRLFVPQLMLLSVLVLLGGCDSTSTEMDVEPAPVGPSGSWTIDPVAFRLNLIVDASAGITQDIQATISGTMTLSEEDGVLSGSGTCSWTSRRHTPRTAQTVEESGTEGFSVSGSIVDNDARLILSGCAWNQIGYRGEFDGDSYALAIPLGAEGPIFDAQVWSDATFIEGDDPAALVLVR